MLVEILQWQAICHVCDRFMSKVSQKQIKTQRHIAECRMHAIVRLYIYLLFILSRSSGANFHSPARRLAT